MIYPECPLNLAFEPPPPPPPKKKKKKKKKKPKIATHGLTLVRFCYETSKCLTKPHINNQLKLLILESDY